MLAEGEGAVDRRRSNVGALSLLQLRGGYVGEGQHAA